VTSIADREGLRLPAIEPRQVIPQNITPEAVERSTGATYPAIYVYCEKLANSLREKFRTFSGTARMAVEVRVSQDRLEGLERKLSLYVEAVTDVLDARRGDWGQGLFYTGGYEVAFGPTKHGGKNFIQTAKVGFDVQVSVV
jgi:Uma2 family endonuclease